MLKSTTTMFNNKKKQYWANGEQIETILIVGTERLQHTAEIFVPRI